VDANMCPPNPDYDPSKPLGGGFEAGAKPKPKKPGRGKPGTG
jgi:hypothetical protein